MKRKEKMRNCLLLCCALLAASTVFGQTGGFWDMAGPTVEKSVLVPTNEPNYPANLVPRTRTVIENQAGDIVFGIWREDNNAVIQNPSIVDGALEFYGLQTAYVENLANSYLSLEKISFDFNPAALTDQELVYFAYAFDVRIEPHASNGTARIRAYLYYEDTSMVNIKSSYTVEIGTWHTVETWIEDGVWYLSLDGDILDEQWDKGYAELTKPFRTPAYPHLYLGAHPLGELRRYSGKLDNLEVLFNAPQCGDWGYLPTDFNRDCYVDILDLTYFASTWLGCTDPDGEDCIQL